MKKLTEVLEELESLKFQYAKYRKLVKDQVNNDQMDDAKKSIHELLKIRDAINGTENLMVQTLTTDTSDKAPHTHTYKGFDIENVVIVDTSKNKSTVTISLNDGNYIIFNATQYSDS